MSKSDFHPPLSGFSSSQNYSPLKIQSADGFLKKTCVVCGLSFPTEKKNQKTCLSKCRKEWRRERERLYHNLNREKINARSRKVPQCRVCVICGKVFHVSGDAICKTCSTDCRRVHDNNVQKAYQMRRMKDPDLRKAMKERQAKWRAENNEKMRLWRREYYHRNRSRILKWNSHRRWAKIRRRIKCKSCSLFFVRSTHNRKYCSRRCLKSAVLDSESLIRNTIAKRSPIPAGSIPKNYIEAYRANRKLRRKLKEIKCQNQKT